MVSVYLYVPNLIGYVRVVLALIGYSYALSDYHVTISAYLVSQLLDAADGYAARVLGQSSKFGAVLDMVTDRASTTCLCVVLGRLYPDWILGLVMLVMLDMFSHWYHMYASLVQGSSSHKEVSNPFLRLYYWKPVLFVACAGTELWYLSLYLLVFTSGPVMMGVPAVKLMLIVCTPISIFKQAANAVQMYVACNVLVEMDNAERKAR
uniref:CDP-diacylglycerol--inositol 3-phosphatidyltransferase n=1 Tax=Haptolina brevifila TaxID=156173 RepID=A0A7S2NIS6_9EUKA|mmetsp:Transcript_78711/g.156520  ORF Transcript_78711/g.156520 Transcript_78711/m.156520 type:complete len:207 (+) Transcript_78711:96-716(+)